MCRNKYNVLAGLLLHIRTWYRFGKACCALIYRYNRQLHKMVMTYDVQLLYEQHIKPDEKLFSMLHSQPNQRLFTLSSSYYHQECDVTHHWI
jgi:hypothetical protein